MSDKWFEDLKNKIESFLANATPQELEEAIDRANYTFYKTVEQPVMWRDFGGDVFVYGKSFTVRIQDRDAVSKAKPESTFKTFEVADRYYYEVAA